MNGAESLVRTLLASGVETCFANPGTSEMHFVAALDRVPGMRCVLALFEGVATGAADGYGRVARRPAATLLHCGPGLANGVANLHNAKRAGSPIVNCVGDQTTYHKPLDPPLAADTAGLAASVSAWVRTSECAASVGVDAAEAVRVARSGNGNMATLILPSDVCWDAGGMPGEPLPPEPPATPEPDVVAEVAAALRRKEPAALFLGAGAERPEGLALAAAIRDATGARLIARQFVSCLARGRGRPAVPRVPYPLEQATEMVADLQHAILVGVDVPVGFFAYPGRAGTILPEAATVHALASPTQDAVGALAALADALGLERPTTGEAPTHQHRPEVSQGKVSPEALGQALAALLPDDAVVIDEALTLSTTLWQATADAAPHDWLQICGGAIGEGFPLATGAALGAPGRRVIGLQADGSGMYTLQALWTQARERLDVTTVVLSNRKYAILLRELEAVNAKAGATVRDMMHLDRPALDWVALANGMGVEAARVEDMRRFADLFSESLRRRGPFLIELVLP